MLRQELRIRGHALESCIRNGLISSFHFEDIDNGSPKGTFSKGLGQDDDRKGNLKGEAIYYVSISSKECSWSQFCYISSFRSPRVLTFVGTE